MLLLRFELIVKQEMALLRRRQPVEGQDIVLVRRRRFEGGQNALFKLGLGAGRGRQCR